MFESAEPGYTMDTATWRREVRPLREALLDAQYDLLQKEDFPVIILVSGVDGAGRGETVNVLNDMIDRSSTEQAPWTLVEADDKQFARIKVLKNICERLEAAL